MLHAFLVADIDAQKSRFAAGLADHGDGLLTGLGPDFRDDHLRAVLGEQQCGFAADAGAGAGDEGHFF